MQWASHGRLINCVRAIWLILIFWYEYGVFRHTGCKWPNPNPWQNANSRLATEATRHVLIVADPQIIDHRSYPDRGWLLSWLTQTIVDLNLRKSWRLASLPLNPHEIIFLGDMMDGGRTAMPDEEYEQYFTRFKQIFKADVPTWYIPGNHDTGLGTAESFSAAADSRYASHFGEPNSLTSIANHTFVMIDAPSFAEEDNKRIERRTSIQDWSPLPNGPFKFIQSIQDERLKEPIILFTHIPLARPTGTSCGLLREKGTIRPGTGFGYQNTLSDEGSTFILRSVRPLIAFSGDDHDYCELRHEIEVEGRTREIKEVTVKSISMVMNVRRPAIHLLSLTPPHLAPEGGNSFGDNMCLLPDQLGIYLAVYLPAFAISIILISYNVARRISQKPSRSRESDEFLPAPTPGKVRRVRGHTNRKGQRWKAFTVGLYEDLKSVALPPILLFFFISLWIIWT